MTAYGAVISLKNTIDYILHSSHFSLAETSQTISQQAYNELQPLQNILERLDKTRTSRSRKKVNDLDGRIKEKIWEFEDKLESLLYQQILSQFPAEQEQVDGDGDEGIKDTSVWQFPGLLESLLYHQILPQFPAKQEQVDGDGDGGIKEARVCLLESSHIPSQFEFKSPNPVPGTSNIHRRRRVVHKHKGDRLLKPRRRKPTRRSRDVLLLSIDVECLQDDVTSFIEMLKDMAKEYVYELENMPREPISTTIGFDSGLPKSKMIGLSDQFQKIKDHVMRELHRTYFQQIAGMAGIGKTTLAKELYEDADIVSRFECRAWVTVTCTMVEEGPHFNEVVQGIVAQLCGGDTLIQGDDQNVGDYWRARNAYLCWMMYGRHR